MVSEIFTFKVIVSTVLRLLLVIIESICDGVNISEVFTFKEKVPTVLRCYLSLLKATLMMSIV